MPLFGGVCTQHMTSLPAHNKHSSRVCHGQLRPCNRKGFGNQAMWVFVNLQATPAYMTGLTSVANRPVPAGWTLSTSVLYLHLPQGQQLLLTATGGHLGQLLLYLQHTPISTLKTLVGD